MITEYSDEQLPLVLEATEKLTAHLTAAVVSNDPLFTQQARRCCLWDLSAAQAATRPVSARPEQQGSDFCRRGVLVPPVCVGHPPHGHGHGVDCFPSGEPPVSCMLCS